MRAAVRWLIVALALPACAGEGAAELPAPAVASASSSTNSTTTNPTTSPTTSPNTTNPDSTTNPATNPVTATHPVTPAPSTTASDPEPQVPLGFGTVAATVTAADGTACEVCLWLADTGFLRQRGLMGVTELGGADGMIFRYPVPHTGTFWMKDTLMPLSIAFFAVDGSFLAAFDMEPCVADPCPTYPTPADFADAIEVPAGGLAELAIAAGSTLSVSTLPCDPAAG